MNVEGWFRRLEHGRIEIFLKTDDGESLKVRASGPEREMFELVDWFEQKTGLTVEGEWRRVRTGPRQMEGQTSMVIPELSPGVEPNEDDIGGFAELYDTPEIR